MSRWLIVLVDYSGGIYDVNVIPKYVADTRQEAEGAVNLMNEVANYKDIDEDGEWFGTHFAIREVEVWSSASA